MRLQKTAQNNKVGEKSSSRIATKGNSVKSTSQMGEAVHRTNTTQTLHKPVHEKSFSGMGRPEVSNFNGKIDGA